MVLHRRFFLFHIVLLLFGLLQSCRSTTSTTATSPTGKIERKPIVEVAEEQLRLDAMLIDAKMQQEVGNHQEAMATYRQILAQQPGYGAANYEMSVILASSGRLDSARVYAERAVQSCDSNVWYRIQLARCYQAMGNYTKVTEEWENIVRQNPETLDYYYELSNQYISAHQISKAIEVLNRVERKIGITEPISLQKQRLWNAISKPEKGIKEIEALAQSLPNEKKYNAIMAESYMQQKQYAKAKPFFDRALAADPTDEYLHLSMASYYKAVNKQQEAYEELRKGFSGTSLNSKSKLQFLANFYDKEEFYGSCSKYSFALLDELMAQCSDSTTYAIFYGDVLMRQGKYAEAARQFELHLTTDSSMYDVWEAMMICEMESNQFNEKLIRHAQRAANLFPTLPIPYYTLAECYHRMGNNKEAFANYDRFLDLDPNDASVLNNYAYYLAQAGEQLEKALSMIEKAIAIEPNNATLLDTYAWVLHKMGRNQEALVQIRKAVKLDKENSATLKDHLKTIESAQ